MKYGLNSHYRRPLLFYLWYSYVYLCQGHEKSPCMDLWQSGREQTPESCSLWAPSMGCGINRWKHTHTTINVTAEWESCLNIHSYFGKLSDCDVGELMYVCPTDAVPRPLCGKRTSTKEGIGTWITSHALWIISYTDLNTSSLKMSSKATANHSFVLF